MSMPRVASESWLRDYSHNVLGDVEYFSLLLASNVEILSWLDCLNYMCIYSSLNINILEINLNNLIYSLETHSLIQRFHKIWKVQLHSKMMFDNVAL